VRLEGQHQRRHAAPFGLLPRRGEEGVMAAMHAVKIADRQNGASERGGHGVERDQRRWRHGLISREVET
jgi:hypothetical protein